MFFPLYLKFNSYILIMKKIILLVLVTLSLASFTTPDGAAFNIVGRWKGSDKKSVGFIVFQADGYAYFEVQGQKMGGKDFVENGKRASMTYKFKEMGKMMHIDIVVKIVGEKNSHSLLGIAEKIDANSFKMQLGYNNVRPKTFDKNETAIFTRVK